MILPCMDLPNNTTHTRTIIPNHHKQIFRNKIETPAHFHDFNMSETLPVCTDFILTLDNKDAPLPQDPMRFSCSVPI